ncbi:universal stress protein [Chloroflexota bacterium]
MTENILIPLDGSKLGESALHYVVQLVSKLKPKEIPEITLLQVIKPRVHHYPVEGGVVDIDDGIQDMDKEKGSALDYLEKAAEELKNEGFTINCKVVLGKIGVSSAESIINAEEELNADLVAMSTHGRRGFSRWAFGSVTEKVLRSGSVPVLMVRVKKET